MARSNKLCYRCLGKSHYGEHCSKTRICGINGCKESHSCLLYGDKFVRTNNEEDEKKKEVMRDLIQWQFMQQNNQKWQDEFVLWTVPVILKNGNRKLVVNAQKLM